MGLWPDTQNCGSRMLRESRERFPRHRLQRKPLISDPSMHHDSCVTHMPWCMSGSLTRGCRVKRSRHSRRTHNPQFYVFGKRPMFISCWLIVNWTLRSKLQCISNQNTNFSFTKVHFIGDQINQMWIRVRRGQNPVCNTCEYKKGSGQPKSYLRGAHKTRQIEILME